MNNNRFEELREQNELTKRSLANKLGVSESIYSRWENNKDIIPTRRLYQLANFYKVNLDYLLGFTSKKISIESSDKIDMNIVPKRMIEIRKDYNETLRQFTDKLNTSNSTWSAYETGKTLILCAFLIEICKIGNYSADWILGRSNNKYIK